jgi:hypothetical protein
VINQLSNGKLQPGMLDKNYYIHTEEQWHGHGGNLSHYIWIYAKVTSWARMHNQVLHDIYSQQSAIRMFKSRNMMMGRMFG